MEDNIYKISDCDYLRSSLQTEFQQIKGTWKDLMHWTLPHRGRYLSGKSQQGPRNNNHIVDPTHIIALRSYVAGFLEGNTSTSRPWYRYQHADSTLNKMPRVREWVDKLTWRSLQIAGSSNLYHALAEAYYDYGVVNTAVLFITELKTGLHFTVLPPGSYTLQNDFRGVANILVREFSMNIKALVQEYGVKDKNGTPDWSNFSDYVRNAYERGDYTKTVEVCHIVKPNDKFSHNEMEVKLNRPWISMTYEIGQGNSSGSLPSGVTDISWQRGRSDYGGDTKSKGGDKFLKIGAFTRKPFIAFRSGSTNNFAYGEKGPTYDSIGIIKSLNKKAISKDVALDQMLNPTLQGPASLRKSYITTSPYGFVPLDPSTAAQGGLKRVFDINPAISALISDVEDLRKIISKMYFQDFMLYMTQNPKTRTAREVDAVQSEQQLVIGPNLQSLNWTLNKPLAEYLAEYTIYEDTYLPEMPDELSGQVLSPIFISIFAQAQKSADLPSVDRFVRMVAELAPIDASIMDKLDVDVLADIYDDRLFLPPGLNRHKGTVDAMREQRQAEAAKQQRLNETIPALAGAAKDMGMVQK